jgi:hypothetical protein
MQVKSHCAFVHIKKIHSDIHGNIAFMMGSKQDKVWIEIGKIHLDVNWTYFAL